MNDKNNTIIIDDLADCTRSIIPRVFFEKALPLLRPGKVSIIQIIGIKDSESR